MKSITLTAAQTAAYDADDMDLVRQITAEAQALANESDTLVEVYTADGIVVAWKYPDDLSAF